MNPKDELIEISIDALVAPSKTTCIKPLSDGMFKKLESRAQPQQCMFSFRKDK